MGAAVSRSSDGWSMPGLEGTQVFRGAIATWCGMDYEGDDGEWSRSSYLRCDPWASSTDIPVSLLDRQHLSFPLAQSCVFSTCIRQGKLRQTGNILSARRRAGLKCQRCLCMGYMLWAEKAADAEVCKWKGTCLMKSLTLLCYHGCCKLEEMKAMV